MRHGARTRGGRGRRHEVQPENRADQDLHIVQTRQTRMREIITNVEPDLLRELFIQMLQFHPSLVFNVLEPGSRQCGGYHPSPDTGLADWCERVENAGRFPQTWKRCVVRDSTVYHFCRTGQNRTVMTSVQDLTRMREYIGNYNCTPNQYYDDYLKTCSPCKDVCSTIPCKICPEFVMTTEPVFKTETAMDASMIAFWVVFCMIIIMLTVLVVAFLLRKRYQLIKMCKEKAWSREVTVSAVEETEQAQMLQTLKEPQYEQANPC